MQLRLLLALILSTLLICHSSRAQDSKPSDHTANDTITVIASGTGVDEEAALKQAFTNSITQAIGTIVDAETIIEDDQIIKDQVLTASNAIIARYKPIGSPKNEAGLITVTIRAEVQRRQLADRLASANVISKPVEGKDLFAQAVTEVQNEKDLAAILRRVFQDFPGNVLLAEPVGQPRLVARTDTDATIQVAIHISVEKQKYSQWYRGFVPVLSKLMNGEQQRWVIPPRGNLKIGLDKNDLLAWQSDFGLKIDGEDARQAVLITDVYQRIVPPWQNHRNDPTLAIFEHQGNRSVTLLHIDPQDRAVAEELLKASFAVPVVEVVVRDNTGAPLDTHEDVLAKGSWILKRGFGASLFWALDVTQGPTRLTPQAGEIASSPDLCLDFTKYLTTSSEIHLWVFPYFWNSGIYPESGAAPGFTREIQFNLTLEKLARMKSVTATISSRLPKFVKQ